MKHQDGRCATDAETIYVQKTANCPAADGTAMAPYCSMDGAVAAVGATRDLIVARGTVGGASSAFAGGTTQISIIGQMNATIGNVNSPAIQLASGDMYVRNVKLGPSTAIGCQGDAGSILRLDHVLVTGNSGGGILLNGAAFDIENTTVTNNGPSADATWGGIRIQNPSASGPVLLHLVTVQGNNPTGVSCSASVTGMGVLAPGNLVSSTCGFSSCATANTTCGAQP
jgi:hypothetical protein